MDNNLDNNFETRKRRVPNSTERLKKRREQRAAKMLGNTQAPEENNEFLQSPPKKPPKPQKPKKPKNIYPKRELPESVRGEPKRSSFNIPPFLSFFTNINNLITVGVLLIVVITVHFFFIRSNSYRIFVGDYHIATIPFGYTTGDDFIELLVARIESELGTTIHITDEIVMRPSNTRGGGHITVEQALTLVSNDISYQVEGAVFVVDGTERFIVPSRAIANELIAYTAQSLAPPDSYITSVDTAGLEIVTRFVDYVLTINRQAALTAIGATTRETMPWVVVDGQSFWSIGAQLGISVEEIFALNPALGSDHVLQPGEIITVAMDVPLFTIHTTEEMGVILSVQPPTEHVNNPGLALGETNIIQEGQPGQMRQVFSISRTNGVETSRHLISQEHLTHPTPYIIEIGS